MKHKTLTALVALATLSTLNSQLSTAHAQGALTPPAGAPAPVMKSLDQIEPRIPVNSLPGTNNGMFVISAPGNYYLTANIVATAGKHGILINAKHVKLDLNGFALIGTGAAGYHAITLLNDDGGDGDYLSVRNGDIRNWDNGITFFSQRADVIEDLRIHGCKAGINLYGVANVRRCYIFGGAGAFYGISVTTDFVRVEDCTVNNISSASTSAAGISLEYGLVSGCLIRSVSGNPARGIQISNPGGVVERCKVDQVYGSATGSIGIKATTVRDCTVTDGVSYANSASATGISAQHIERCTVKNIAGGATSGSGIGILGAASGGLVAQCLVDGVAGAGAQGVSVGTNQFSVTDTKISNITGNGSPAAGIYAGSGSWLKASGCDITTVTNLSAAGGWGILIHGGLVERCNISGARTVGIYDNGSSTVLNCSVRKCGINGNDAGIWASSAGNQVEGNSVFNCYIGIQLLPNSSGAVLRNTCGLNTVNYSVAGASAAPIVTAANAGAATNPFANLSW